MIGSILSRSGHTSLLASSRNGVFTTCSRPSAVTLQSWHVFEIACGQRWRSRKAQKTQPRRKPTPVQSKKSPNSKDIPSAIATTPTYTNPRPSPDVFVSKRERIALPPQYLSIKEPLNLFTGPKDLGLQITSLSAATFCGLQAALNYSVYVKYAPFTWLWSSGMLISACWMAVFAWCLPATYKLVGSIDLMPPPEGRGDATSHKTMIRITPLRLIPFTPYSTSPKIIPADDAFKLLSISGMKRSLEDQKISLEGRDGFLVNIFRNTINVVSRHTMAYIRTEDHGVWKMNLRGGRLLDNGAPLETLLKQDRAPPFYLRNRQGRSPFMDEGYR